MARAAADETGGRRVTRVNRRTSRSAEPGHLPVASGQMAVILPDLARLGVSFDSVWVYPLRSLDELRREVYLAWHPHRLETRPHLTSVTDKLASVLKFGF